MRVKSVLLPDSSHAVNNLTCSPVGDSIIGPLILKGHGVCGHTSGIVIRGGFGRVIVGSTLEKFSLTRKFTGGARSQGLDRAVDQRSPFRPTPPCSIDVRDHS